MNKSEFFSLLEDNQSEIIMTNTRIRSIQRGSVVEVVLSIQGYGVITLSRHKPGSQKLTENEVKFDRWFAEWTETESEPMSVSTLTIEPVEVSATNIHHDLFLDVEFISMKVVRERETKKKPGVTPAKVTQQKKIDKDHPQTSTQYLNALRSVFANSDYYLLKIRGIHNLSEIITYVFMLRRGDVSFLCLFHQTVSVFPLVVAQNTRAPP
ncbi:hypothetical protein F3J37_01005 [Pantoea sp. Al-1710]|uniref:Uncharacterized protein n=1 Tax=Candidatus Pantoea communis TaxID=2608354 RepID=A0ABX0RJH5_9GAMM|nr:MULTISPECIES: hypothetical protein [Pantoea]NIG13045.1 hypothetical protein [Pantoea sp. Cy-640]NIG17254.1 hypothetical protein [Pantoea communis]